MEPKKNDLQNDLFPPIGVEAESNVPPVELSEHQKEVEALKTQIASQDERFQKQNDDFMKMLASRPNQQVQQVQQQASAPVEQPLPDVLEDPEGYAREINTRAERNAQRIVTEQTSQLTNKYNEDRKYERVYAKFKTIDSKIATENADLVEFIAVKKVKAAAAGGIDVNSYIFADEDRFASEVMNEVKQQLGLSAADDNDRTAGLVTENKLPTSTPAPKEEQGQGFMDSMKALRYRGR